MARSQTPLEQFVYALHHENVDQVRELLATYPDVRAAINDPISHFQSRPVARATKNLPLLDVLLEYGADLNLKSAWWAGGFGLLEHGITPAEAAPLIGRGAVVDVFAAAHLGMFDRLRELVEDESSLVRARGGDGKTPLHCATTVAIARYVLDKGADIEARDVDHESTPAQYLVREAPDVTRLLVERGAWFDIFIAVGLRDHSLVERCLREDPDSHGYRTWHGKYTVAHDGKRPATTAEIGDRRGDIYRWVFGHNVSAIDVARDLGDHHIERVLLSHATPMQRLLAACSRADHSVAEAIVAGYPGIVATISPDDQRLIADKAHANDTAAVALMLDLGFDPIARGVDNWEPIRWAAFHGNAEMTKRLLAYSPPINVPDPSYGGTLLGACIYGSVHGWHSQTGDFKTTAQILIEAGERVDPSRVPTGRDDVDAVLKKYLS
jgi:ankyrin repeat protein